MHPSLVDAVVALLLAAVAFPLRSAALSSLVLLLRHVGGVRSLAVLVVLPVAADDLIACLYVVLLLALPTDAEPSEHHVVSLSLSAAVASESVWFFPAVPVVVLLAWNRWLQRRRAVSLIRFAAELLLCVAASVLLTGPVATAAWIRRCLLRLMGPAAVVLGVALAGVGGVAALGLRPGTPAARKAFHVVVVAVCAAPFLLTGGGERAREAVALGGFAGVCVLLLLELVRHHVTGNRAVAALNAWYEGWIDAKVAAALLPPILANKFVQDRGKQVATTHLYLVGGCMLPFAVEEAGVLGQWGGVLAVGLGDAAAALVGSRWGRVHWWRSKRTVEGSVAMATVVAAGALAVGAPSVRRAVLLGTVCATVEVVTRLDNLILPLVALALRII